MVANKSDAAPDAGAGVGARLGLEHLEGRAKRVQPVCALTGDGVREGLQWLVEQARPPATPGQDSAWRRGPLPHVFVGVGLLGIKGYPAWGGD